MTKFTKTAVKTQDKEHVKRLKPTHFGKKKTKHVKQNSVLDNSFSRAQNVSRATSENSTNKDQFDLSKKKYRAELSQNFLKNPSLGAYLIKLAGINARDSVLEIGSGTGVLTESLAKLGAEVVAIEKDEGLVLQLSTLRKIYPKLQIVEADFLKFKNNLKSYKVFANPPFSISSALVKKLIFIPNQPQEIYLFLQKEFANRLLARHFETQLSVLVKTFYQLQIVHQFKGEDFSPVPGVIVVMLKFVKHKQELIGIEDMPLYVKMVMYGFQAQKSSLEKNFKKVFTHEQWKKIAARAGFDIKAQPAQLSSRQWVEIFQVFKSSLVSPERKLNVVNFIPREK